MSMSRRAVGIAALAVSGFALSACGSDQLFHDSTIAASRGTTQVSTEQVQEAVTQIKKAFGPSAAEFDARSAITYLVFADDFQRIAGKAGGAISMGEARKEFTQRKLSDPSTAALNALRSNIALNAIGRSPQGQQEIGRIVKEASVQVNPRFGKWDGVKGVIDPAQPWIVPTTKSPAS